MAVGHYQKMWLVKHFWVLDAYKSLAKVSINWSQLETTNDDGGGGGDYGGDSDDGDDSDDGGDGGGGGGGGEGSLTEKILSINNSDGHLP